MSHCDRINTCLFYNEKLPVMPLVKHMMKNDYCRGNSSSCARHILIDTLGDADQRISIDTSIREQVIVVAGNAQRNDSPQNTATPEIKRNEHAVTFCVHNTELLTEQYL